MAGGYERPGKPTGTYSPAFGFIYIFNLVIGVGALALPKAFSEAGLALGTFLLVALCFMSFLNTTYMIEAMAAANAYTRLERRRCTLSVSAPGSPDIQKADESLSISGAKETTPLIGPVVEKEPIVADGGSITPPDDYDIDEKYEMGTMANMFYHPVGIVLYYITICLYLYGDLAIYAVAIPKSMTKAVCHDMGWIDLNASHNWTSIENWTAINNWTNVEPTAPLCFGRVTKQQAYYIFLAITVVLLCPWTFFNLTRSKYLQLLTTVLRNVAFILMIVVAVVQLGQGKHADPFPPAATLKGFPVLFGVSIYSFMCQHSLPGMVTPMRSKRHITRILLSDYGLILTFYLVLSYTGAFRFSYDTLEDLYTLNFFTRHGAIVLVIIGYFLVLFPVFTLSTNFPIISITLRENLKALVKVLMKPWMKGRDFHPLFDRIFFPLLAIVPPILMAFATQNETLLVSITGSIPGVGVQYVIPATLAFAGKYVIVKKYGKGRYLNKHRSLFGHVIFFVLVMVWTVISWILIITDDAIKIAKDQFLE